jgi:tetratricopeptide (TPR) repeat protein
VAGLCCLCLIRYQSAHSEDAIRHYEEAVRIRPDYAEVYYNLGIVLENAGRVQEAIRHFEQALRINPGAIEARNKLARLRAVQ